LPGQQTVSFAIESSPEIWHRDDFPILANWRRLWRMVEVGVDRAVFAHHFLSRWQGAHYYGVDDYEPFPESNWDRQADFLMAVARLEQFGDRARLIKLPSGEAAKLFAPGSVDFVYIDGAHDAESVRADQAAHCGVKPAVTEFARDLGQTIYLTAVEGYGQEECPSWYIYKSGMPGPDWRRC
jgi:hypothetical protein